MIKHILPPVYLFALLVWILKPYNYCSSTKNLNIYMSSVQIESNIASTWF
jgi:hypothetical protein